MHDDLSLNYGDIVTIEPQSQYAAGYWFTTDDPRTVEWSRRLKLAHDRGDIVVVDKPEISEFGDIHLESGRHIYLDTESQISLYYDDASGTVEIENADTVSVGDFEAGSITIRGIEITGDIADPMNYGATGDGTTDDSDAFQAAADSVAPDGTVIYHRDHQLNTPVDSKGADVIRLSGTLYADPDSTNSQYRIGYESNDIAMLYSDGHDDVTFSIRADGRDQYTCAGALWHGDRLTFRNCHVKNCANTGLQFMGNRATGEPPVRDSQAVDCYVEGCVWNYVFDGAGKNVTFSESRSKDANGRHVSADSREAAGDGIQTSVEVSNVFCDGHRETPVEWDSYPVSTGTSSAVRGIGTEMEVSDVTITNWPDYGVGGSDYNSQLIVTDYIFRNDVGDAKGTALFIPRGAFTVVDSMTVIRANLAVELAVADDGGGHVDIRNCSFVGISKGFNNVPATLPSEWIIEGNYDDRGIDISP